MSTAEAWMAALREFVRARLEEPQVVRRFAAAPPPHPIVARLALPPEAERFVWATVAVAIDPLMHAHALLVGGTDARRGLAVAAYATMVGLPPAAAIELAAWLNQRPRLVEVGLLDPALRDVAPLIAWTSVHGLGSILAHAGDQLGLDLDVATTQVVDGVHRALRIGGP